MQIRTLQAFVEIIRCNGFSAAARKMHATQSTMSKALTQLEQHYDAQLVERGKGQLRLTSAGEYVLRHATRILAEEAEAHRDIAELKGLKRGRLRIGLPPIGNSVLFAPVLAAYTKSHPQIDIEIVEHGAKKLEELVKAGDLDLAALLFPIADGLHYQEVRNEPVVALVARGQLKHKGCMRMEELAEHPFVFFESQFALSPIVQDAFRARGIEPKIAARSSQIDFIFGLVAAGMGIGFLPKFIVEERHYQGVDMVEIEGNPLQWHMVLVWRERARLGYAAQEWLALSKILHHANHPV